LFWEQINLRFDKGKTEYKTCVGAFSTIVFVSIIFGFSLQRIIRMLNFVDARVKTEVQFDYFNDDFRYKDKLNTFAFGITKF
jgi:hypothetical protein